MKYFLVYLCIVNAAGFILMLTDKIRAKKNMWRILERTLLLTATAGGSIGCIAGMYLFRHKTKHLQFTLGLPIIFAIQVIVLVLVFSHLQ